MTRVGSQTIDIPSGVKVTLEEGQVLVEGPRGALTTAVPEQIKLILTEGQLVAHREGQDKTSKSLHGLIRSLVANAVTGVTQGFQKELDVVGIGSRAEVQGNILNLSLGFSHPVVFPAPEGIEIKVERGKKTINNYVATIVVLGNDKQQVGQVAADIRSLKPPDTYKGKGIRYVGEAVRTKVGKKGV